jgi:hypothetical protein
MNTKRRLQQKGYRTANFILLLKWFIKVNSYDIIPENGGVIHFDNKSNGSIG